jgi:DNA primase
MAEYKSLVAKLVDEDFGISGHGRWYRSDDHSSLVVDDERGLFFYNAENISGDAVTYLLKVRGWDFKNAINFAKQFKGYKATYTYTVEYDKSDVVVYPKLVDTFWAEGRENRDYWYNRGLTDETVNRFKLGHHDGWFLIPFFIDSAFRNFQMRREIPDKRIKSWYKGVGPLLFNSDLLKVADKVIITEGPVDAILLNQNGIPAVSHNGGAENWLYEWFEYFIYAKEIIIVYDNDKPGMIGAKKVAKNLGIYRCKLYNFAGYEDKYDVVDFFRDGGTKDEFERIVKDESKYLFEL